ncbi:extensin family protein [Benzoatithermus flavus]|uniref:Extensin family protein n=1 Tax=Benzoatithermus flavus TaxID=3108223 RepID=A0ABU8XN24_9PROT
MKPPRSTTMRLVALLALLLPAGCSSERAQGIRGAEPYRLSGAACLAVLRERGIAVGRWQHIPDRSCRVDTPVRAGSGRLASFVPPLETSCAMLVAWSDFEAEVNRAARTHLRSPVVAVQHYGSYACRSMTGNAGRASLHARARALDISGFRLADGRIVTVHEGWRGTRAEQRFLRAVASAACRRFSVTLTPESDRRHQDHLHVDIGPWRQCGL